MTTLSRVLRRLRYAIARDLDHLADRVRTRQANRTAVCGVCRKGH